MQQFAGCIKETVYNTTYEVYADLDETTGRPEHIYVVKGRRQMGDFPFGSPTNVLESAAQLLVSSEAESIEFSDSPDEVIDWADTLRMNNAGALP